MLETQADFARRLGHSRAHVTRLKKAGRLVMREGKVVVDASLELLGATESPLARDQANRERLAQQRAEAPAQTEDADLAAIGLRHKMAQIQKLEHEAEMARLERERIEGTLVPIDDVKNAGIDIATATRTALEGLADRYAPELVAVTDTNQAHALLSEAIELVLDELARELGALAKSLRAP